MTSKIERRAPSRHLLREGALAALFSTALALAGCGGGGHGGANSPSSVGLQTIAPPTGPFIGGTAVTLHGRNFALDDTNVVLIGGHPCTSVVVVDDQTLTCRTPAGTPGAAVDVVVQNARGQAALALGFVYLNVAPATSDVNGDGIADLIVAAPGDDSAGVDAGAVYVFFGSEDPLTLTNRSVADADVKLTGFKPGDNFGACVCAGDLDGDHVDDLVVGANHVDAIGTPDAGAVYVFKGPFTHGQVIQAPAAQFKFLGDATVPGDLFGSVVALADATGDGQLDLIVTAPGHDVQDAPDSGCVYVFRGGAGMVGVNALQAGLTYDGGQPGDHVGDQIACGDINGDGRTDLVMCSSAAAAFDDMLEPNAGKVYVAMGQANPVSRAVAQCDLILSGEAAGDRFGTSAAVADVNGDGVPDLIVGAPYHDGVDVDTGRVYVFLGGAHMAGGSASTADVFLSGIPTHNSFGQCLRTGDFNGDAIPDLLIGAPHADYLNDENGRAYLFLGSRTLADAVAVDAFAVLNGENAQGDEFGGSVALLDANGDGFADLVCTSAFHANGAGRAYVWFGSTGTLAGVTNAGSAHAIISGLQAGEQFGASTCQGQ